MLLMAKCVKATGRMQSERLLFLRFPSERKGQKFGATEQHSHVDVGSKNLNHFGIEVVLKTISAQKHLFSQIEMFGHSHKHTTQYY